MVDPLPDHEPDHGADRLDDAAVEERLTRLDDLLAGLERVPGPTAEAAMECIQALTEVYGEGLARILGWVGPGVLARCVDDRLVRHLMVLHDLHPHSVEQRVRQVIDEISPQVVSHGGQLELITISDGVARVKIAGGHGVPVDLVVQAVTEAVLALAPELESVETLPGDKPQVLIPVDALLHRPMDQPVGARS